MNKDTLKKHHFWILLGLIPLLVLIAVITISSGVGAAIEGKRKEITEAEGKVKGKVGSVKGEYLIGQMGKRVETLAEKRTKLWQSNWDQQRRLFTWPSRLSKFNYDDKGNGPKFGAQNLPTASGEFDEFRKPEVYLREYENMAKVVAPTQFGAGGGGLGGLGGPGGSGSSIFGAGGLPPVFGGGGPGPGFGRGGLSGLAGFAAGAAQGDDAWRSVLRHVSDWGQQQLTATQIWLALEDIWVQRSMLDAVRTINEQMAVFERKDLIGPNERKIDDAKHRLFESKLWKVELEVAEKDGKRVLKGKLTNNTDRLQLLGIGNTMTLNVWLSGSKKDGAEPFRYKIGGEFWPGRATMEVVFSETAHVIPATMPVVEIFDVEQVFDARTVPVRRIDRLVLGYPDARNAAAAPMLPEFIKEETVDQTAPGGPGGPAGPGPGGLPGGRGGSGPAGEGGPGASGGFGAMFGGAGGGVGNGWVMVTGGGPVTTVVDGTKKRYLGRNEQVRRMPVAISLVTDQAFMEDALLAFANSPLRFQVTQVHWSRFHGALGGPGLGGSAGPTGEGGVVLSGSGQFGSGFGGEEGGRGMRRPGFRLPFGGGVSGPGPGGPGPGSEGPMFGGPGGFPFGGFGASSVSEGQLTSGLIDLTIYGVVSLYEKYQPPAEAPANPDGTPPTSAPPTNNPPMNTPPGNTPPMETPAPTNPPAAPPATNPPKQ